jgi:ribosomal protein S27E
VLCDVTGKGPWKRGQTTQARPSTRRHEPSHAMHKPKQDSGTFCRFRCRSCINMQIASWANALSAGIRCVPERCPSIAPPVTSGHGPRLASSTAAQQSTQTLAAKKPPLAVTRSCFSPRIGGCCHRNAGPAKIYGCRLPKLLVPGRVYSAVCAAYCGLDADMLPYTDSQHVIRSPHRDVPTRIHSSHSDLAASPSGGEDRYTSRAISFTSKSYGTLIPSALYTCTAHQQPPRAGIGHRHTSVGDSAMLKGELIAAVSG